MEEIKIKNANDARILSENSAEKNFELAIGAIENQAKLGYTECILWNRISFEGAKKLLELGFSISEFMHPIEQRKTQKVSW